MNKLMIIAVAVGLTLGGCATQQPTTSGRYDRDRYEQRNDRYTNDRLEERLERYANELNLSRRQIRDIQQIQNKYERRGQGRNNNRGAYRQMQQQKQREMLSVLTPSQRDRFYQLERNRRDNRYDNRRG